MPVLHSNPQNNFWWNFLWSQLKPPLTSRKPVVPGGNPVKPNVIGHKESNSVMREKERGQNWQCSFRQLSRDHPSYWFQWRRHAGRRHASSMQNGSRNESFKWFVSCSHVRISFKPSESELIWTYRSKTSLLLRSFWSYWEEAGVWLTIGKWLTSFSTLPVIPLALSLVIDTKRIFRLPFLFSYVCFFFCYFFYWSFGFGFWLWFGSRMVSFDEPQSK